MAKKITYTGSSKIIKRICESLNDVIDNGGGGGGGTSNYNDLTNKPSINNVTLSGNKSTADLGINIPTKTSQLTNDSNFVGDASYVHTDNNYTSTEKAKLASLNNVSITPTLSSGTKIADYEINGTQGALYAPSGGGGSGSSPLFYDSEGRICINYDLLEVR